MLSHPPSAIRLQPDQLWDRLVAGPAVAASSPTNWWILGVRATGTVYVQVTDDAGTDWTTMSGHGLPVLDVATYLAGQDDAPVGLTVVNDRVAVAKIGSTTIYVTNDGGASWTPLTPSTL